MPSDISIIISTSDDFQNKQEINQDFIEGNNFSDKNIWLSKLQWDIASCRSEWPSLKNLQTINAGEGVEKRECSCTVGGNGNWLQGTAEDGMEIPLKTRDKTTYDLAIPLLGIYPEEAKTEKDTCIPLFIAAIYSSQDTKAA